MPFPINGRVRPRGSFDTGERTLFIHRMGDYMRHRADLDTSEKKSVSCLRRESNLVSPAHSLVTSTDCPFLASNKKNKLIVNWYSSFEYYTFKKLFLNSKGCKI